MTSRAIPVCFATIFLSAPIGSAQTTEPLKLETTIELSDVQGRIDHLSVDVRGQRLFVSALGNNTVEVIDLKSNLRARTIPGLQEPQGVLYVPTNNRLYVANGKGGAVKIFDGTSFQLLKTIEYGDDADNLRYDASQTRIYVGYGDGALGELDAEGRKAGEIKLDAHPESFQLEKRWSANLRKRPGIEKDRRRRPREACGGGQLGNRVGAG